MDYLFNTTLKNIPKSYTISCYYIVDDNLKYISLKNNNTFFLYSVDSDSLGTELKESSNELQFDCHVLNASKPVVTQKSCYEKILDKIFRVVRVKSSFHNPLSRKPKQTTDKTILNRYITNKKKLF